MQAHLRPGSTGNGPAAPPHFAPAREGYRMGPQRLPPLACGERHHAFLHHMRLPQVAGREGK